MADDPRREALVRWRHVQPDELSDTTSPTLGPAMPHGGAQTRSRQVGTTLPHAPRHPTNDSTRPTPMVLHHSAIRTDVPKPVRLANGRYHYPGVKDGTREAVKGVDPQEENEEASEKDAHQKDVYTIQRERLRRMERRYAELQQALGRPVEPSADYDFISYDTRRDQAMHTAEYDEQVDNNQQVDHPPESQQTELPSEPHGPGEQEFDDNFWSSFYDHEQQQHSNGVTSRLHETNARSRSNSDVSQTVDPQADPYENAMPDDTIPDVSLSPPLSPVPDYVKRTAAHHARQTRPVRNPHSAPASPPQPVHAASNSQSSGFPTWTVGFLAGCLVVGLGGFFMEELLEVASVVVKTAPFTLSRTEQREMSRRLDLLQLEFANFRAARDSVQRQSELLVDEVRAHLVKMKAERERHQLLIAQEMEALRAYVQGVTGELVEQEKEEIRQRLIETIAEGVEELPDDDDEGSQATTANTTVAVDVDGHVVESTSRVDVAPVEHVHIVTTTTIATSVGKVDAEEIPAPPFAESSNSWLSWELVLLVVAIGLLAGFVGLRVRNVHRRKKWFQDRRARRMQLQRLRERQAAAAIDEDDVEDDADGVEESASESGVETVAQMMDSDGESIQQTVWSDEDDGQAYHYEASDDGESGASPPPMDEMEEESKTEEPTLWTQDSSTNVYRRRVSEDVSRRRSPRLQRTQRSPLSAMR